MKTAYRFRTRGRQPGGFSFLGILIVVVIIMILAGFYFGGDDDKAGIDDYYNRSREAVGVYPMVTDRARSVVENVNVNAFQTDVNAWVLSHPGQHCTIEALQKDPSISVPVPPPGFRYEIDEENKVVLVQDQATNVPPPR